MLTKKSSYICKVIVQLKTCIVACRQEMQTCLHLRFYFQFLLFVYFCEHFPGFEEVSTMILLCLQMLFHGFLNNGFAKPPLQISPGISPIFIKYFSSIYQVFLQYFSSISFQNFLPNKLFSSLSRLSPVLLHPFPSTTSW